MRIFDETKTKELKLENIDFKKGYLKNDKKFVAHHETVEGKKAVYKDRIERLQNGSTQVWKDLVTPAVKAKEAYDEYEDIKVFVLYTAEELTSLEISDLKSKLAATDYQAIKFAEGLITAEKYAEMKAQRQAWRDRINELESILKEQ